MANGILGWVRRAVDAYRRQALAGQLHRLSDHQLDDLGLRRGQLHDMLRLPAKPLAPRRKAIAGPVTRPSLQGCG